MSWENIKEKLGQRKFWVSVGSWTMRGGLVIVFGLILLVSLVYWGAFGDIPQGKSLVNIQQNVASEVYASNKELLGKYYLVNRTEVPFEELPLGLLNALVATEDARFFEHAGVDTRSLFRVAFKSVLLGDRSSGGGSTISQQLAKNLFPRGEFGIFTLPINKIKEIIIARRLENLYSKEEILHLYLNTVPFGENMFGIGTASERFFNKETKNLKVEESAVLVGMLKATTYYNPVKNLDRSFTRRNVVLDQMEKYGFLSYERADSLKKLPLKTDPVNVTARGGIAAYFRQILAEEVKSILGNIKKDDGSTWNMYTDGLKIHTTIDPRIQRYAEEAVSLHMAQLQKTFDKHWKDRKLWTEDDKAIQRAIKQSSRYKQLKRQGLSEEKIMEEFSRPVAMELWSWKGYQEKKMSPLDSILYYKSFLHAGMMVMDPQSGAVKAWVGGINHTHFKYDHVTSHRQVGSTFKPFVYAAAIDQGIPPCEYVPNEKITYDAYNKWSPGNADGKYEGYYSLTGGLVNSVNTVSAAVMMKVGVNEAWKFAKKFGFESDLPKDPTLVLGTADLTLKEMVGAYSTFANRGQRVKPVFISSIETANGEVLVSFPKRGEKIRVMEETEADMVNRMLRMVVDSGTGRRLRFRYKLGSQIAGKTGTTQDQTDGWFMGVTPNLVVGVWVGGDERKVRFRSLSLGQGANTALPIYGLFMKKIYSDVQYRKYRNDTFQNPGLSAIESMDCSMYVMELEKDRIETIQELLERIREYRDERRRFENEPVEERRKRRRNNWKDLFRKKEPI